MNTIGQWEYSLLSILLDAAVKSAVLFAGAWAMTTLLRRASAATRHLIWTLAVSAALALPALALVVPLWRLHVLPADWDHSVVTPQIVASIPSPTVPGKEQPLRLSPTEAHSPATVAPARPSAQRSPEPAISPTGPVDFVHVSSPAHQTSPSQHSNSRDRAALWILAVWATGVSITAAFWFAGEWSVRRMGRRASAVANGNLTRLFDDARRELSITRSVRLLISDSPAMPMAWGSLCPRVLLPVEAQSWAEDRVRSVILHELAHVRRWDCATQAIAHLAASLYWFNPLAWVAARQMRAHRERASDDVVLALGSPAAEYAGHLVSIARSLQAGRLTNIAGVAMARRSGLSGRVGAILNSAVNHGGLTRRMLLISTLAVLAMVLPLSAIHLAGKFPAVSAALAAAPATAPETQENLAELPERFATNRVAVQVLSPGGKPLAIDSIQHIAIWTKPDMSWSEGMDFPISARYAGGWVLVDRQNFALGLPGQRIDFTFVTHGTAMTVSSVMPNDAVRKLTLTAPADSNETGIDTSSGPTAASDELAGVVVDPKGQPVAGAVVSFPTMGPDPIRKPVTTGADGVFRFPGFSNQWYVFLQVEKAGFGTRWLTDLSIGHGFTVHLDNQTRLKGDLKSPDGSPAAGADLQIVTIKPTTRIQMGAVMALTKLAKADERGHYDVQLEPGEYEIQASASNGGARFEHVLIPSGQSVGLPGNLKPATSLKIISVDTITGKPASGMHFYIADPRPGEIGPKKGSMRTSDDSGSVSWDGLTPGQIQIMVFSDNYGRWWTDEAEKQQPWFRGIESLKLTVTDPMRPQTLHVEPAMIVTGQVLSPTGEPVAKAWVDVAGLQTGDARYMRPTDDKGNFKLAFPGVAVNFGEANKDARFTIVASDSQHRWANATGESFSPEPGKQLTESLKVTAGALIRGKVVNSKQEPIANLRVEGQPGDHLDQIYYNPRALTDAGGNFVLGPMRAGKFSIYMSPDLTLSDRTDAPPVSLDVAEGDHLDIGSIVYDGATPSPVPAEYYQMVGNPRPQPVDPTLTWRAVEVTKSVAKPLPPFLGFRMPNQNQATEDEQELLGTPAATGILSGKIVDEAGNPIEGVTAKIGWAPGNSKTSDAEGLFSFARLGNRKVEIRFSKDGYCPKYIPQQPTGLSDLVVLLNNKTYFEGKVLGVDGNPVADALIRADQGPKQGDGVTITNVWTEATTDAQGNYKMYVDPDSYDLQVRIPGVGTNRTGKIAIAKGESKHLDIHLMTGVMFRARVVDSETGQPVAGLRLSDWQYPDIEGTSDASGSLSIDGLMPGKFEFRQVEEKGYARWWSEQAKSVYYRKQIDNRPSGPWQRNFDGLDFDMQPGMAVVTITVERGITIRGKVVDPDGQPVAAATVAPALSGTGNSFTGDTRFSVSTQSDGTFEMEMPASGDRDYNLVAHDGKFQQWRKWANGILPPFRTKPGQEMNDVTIALTRPARVRGRVADANGAPVANRQVRASAADKTENRYYDPTTKTDKDGNFELKYVRPGEQFIQVAPFWLNADDAPAGTSQKVTLTADQALADVNLTAVPQNH